MKSYIQLVVILIFLFSMNSYGRVDGRLGIDYSMDYADEEPKKERERIKNDKTPFLYICYELDLNYEQTGNYFSVKTFPKTSDEQFPALYGDEIVENNGVQILDFIDLYESQVSHKYKDKGLFGELTGLYYSFIPWKSEPTNRVGEVYSFSIEINMFDGQIPDYTNEMALSNLWLGQLKSWLGKPENLRASLTYLEQKDGKVSHIIGRDIEGKALSEFSYSFQCKMQR